MRTDQPRNLPVEQPDGQPPKPIEKPLLLLPLLPEEEPPQLGADAQQAWAILIAPADSRRVKMAWPLYDDEDCFQTFHWVLGTVTGAPLGTPHPGSGVTFEVRYDDGQTRVEVFKPTDWLKSWDVERSRYYAHEIYLGSLIEQARHANILENRADPAFRAASDEYYELGRRLEATQRKIIIAERDQQQQRKQANRGPGGAAARVRGLLRESRRR